MNPDFEKYIPQIIELHKTRPGARINWQDIQIEGIGVTDIYSIKIRMIEMGVIAPDPPENRIYTMLKDFNFDLESYKEKQRKEREKKNIDYELVKRQLEDYPNVQRRARRAIKISIISFIVSAAIAIASLIINILRK